VIIESSESGTESDFMIEKRKDSESVAEVGAVEEKRSADYWILETGATNHVTGNHHLSSLVSFD